MKKGIIVVLAGVLLGVIGSRYLFVGSWFSLIPWTIVGLAIGAWGVAREWLWLGALFGFSLSFVFMASGYSGDSSLISRFPFFALLGLFGGICGAGLGLIGFQIKKIINKSKP